MEDESCPIIEELHDVGVDCYYPNCDCVLEDEDDFDENELDVVELMANARIEDGFF